MLFSLTDYRTRFRISGTAQDAQIDVLRRVVSSAIERICNRVLEDDGADVTEYHDGDYLPYLLLRRPPVASVTGIWLDPTRGFDSATLLPATSYYIVEAGNPMHAGMVELNPSWTASVALFGVAPSFGDGRAAIKVVYRGGFTDIPADLREAAMLWAFHMANHHPGVTSETIGSYSASYEQSSRGAVPREVQQLLAPFMRKGVGRRT